MEKLIYVHLATLGKSRDDCCAGSTNDWYLIKQSDGGDSVELTPAFGDARHCGVALLDTNCEVIGSCIYVIGGASIWQGEVGYEGSNMIHFIDTRYPKDGWRTCCTLPFIHSDGGSTVVDNQWLYVFGGNRHNHCLPGQPWGFAVNVNDSKVRKLAPPADLGCYPTSSTLSPDPIFSTLLSLGTVVVYTLMHGILYELDCKNCTWTVVENLPYHSGWLINCTTVVDDGIFYIYDSLHFKFTSYDIRNRKELYAVDLPHSFRFAREIFVKLIVLSKNRFCIVWEWGEDFNKLLICYSRFSVSFHLPEPTIDLEEHRAFPVSGYSLLNVVAVDPISDEANSSSVNGNAVHE